MSTTITPEAQYAQAVDTELAELNEAEAKLATKLGYVRHQLAVAVFGHAYNRVGKAAAEVTAREIYAAVSEALADPTTEEWKQRNLSRLVAERDALRADRHDVLTRASELDRIYAAHGWSRFFLVRNTNGHIHSSLRCKTCYETTIFGWLPALSGLTEADAVEAYGGILCSVCYPSAPVEWTDGESKEAIEARAERDAKKAERAAKKVEKALIPEDPEGGYVTSGSHNDRVKTTAAAKSWLTEYYDWKGYGGDPEYTHPSYSTEDALAIAALLVGRPGVKETTPEAVLAAAKKRSEKRR